MIGVFDSGLGGLTVASEIFRQLPGRRVVYFGDIARTPYGTKSRDLVRRYAQQDAEFLLSKGAKIIVVACNTVSAHGVEMLRQNFDIPIFEVVMPAVRRAASVTRGRVGVIGTRGTISSGIYERKMLQLSPQVRINSVACPLFVPLVEEGWIGHSETLSIAKEYLHPLRLARIDTLILGCTHYPFLRSVIRQAIGGQVKLVDPAQDTVAELVDYLAHNPGLDAAVRTPGQHEFYVSDRTEHFVEMAKEWLGTEVVVQAATAG
ncbi:glutamate racemase [Patescibacteria group bacterium]|nr:glutamate racemase [Patescibacteria group bacterium]MBU1028611.1 glutamate racemase [Patescibacteria group bacterium]MBU1915667.1 glutamate racemase [Patescibacteria group bacterium]